MNKELMQRMQCSVLWPDDIWSLGQRRAPTLSQIKGVTTMILYRAFVIAACTKEHKDADETVPSLQGLTADADSF